MKLTVNTKACCQQKFAYINHQSDVWGRQRVDADAKSAVARLDCKELYE